LAEVMESDSDRYHGNPEVYMGQQMALCELNDSIVERLGIEI